MLCPKVREHERFWFIAEKVNTLFLVSFEQHQTPTSKHTFNTCFVYFHHRSLITCNMAQRGIRVKKWVCAIRRLHALDGSAFFKWYALIQFNVPFLLSFIFCILNFCAYT